MRKIWQISFKQTVGAVLLWVLLFLIAVLPFLVSRVGQASGMPAVVYVLENPEDPDSVRMAGFLQSEGFSELSDEETLRTGLRSGEFDAGLVIPADLGKRLEAHEVQGVIRILMTPTTLAPNIRREEVTAALFAVYAPYLTAKSLDGTGISVEEVREEYYARTGDPSRHLFTFDVIEENGAPLPPKDTGRRFFLGALSLLLYLTAYFAVSSPLLDRTRSVAARIGRRNANKTVLIPGTVFRVCFLLAAAAVSALLSRESGLLLSIFAFVVLVQGVHDLFLRLPGEHWKDVVVLLVAAFSLVLCPVFLDLALFFPPLKALRFLLPPYWLFGFAGF